MDRVLRDAAAHVEYPRTPDLASTVRRRIENEEPRHSPSWTRFLSRHWIAAAVIVLISLPVLAGIVTLAGGGSGVGGEGGAVGAGGSASGGGDSASGPESASEAAPEPSGRTTEETAADTGSLSDSAAGGSRAAPLGEGLISGERLSLREARARSSVPILLPAESNLRRPDEVYESASRTDGYTLVYGARDGLPPLDDTGLGLILAQSAGGVDTYLEDADIPGAEIEEVRVNGNPAYWLPAGDVLIWERDGRALRLQAKVGRDKAIRIAESVR